MVDGPCLPVARCPWPDIPMTRATRTVLCMILGVLIGVLRVSAAPATMRVDYYHTGNDKQESFSLDRVVIEPLPWPGNPKRPLDTTNSGKYLFEVIDKATGKPLYSRGFAS